MGELTMTTIVTWAGIAICICQSAMFFGLNLAIFSISHLRLDVEAAPGNSLALKLLKLREDSNFVLTTVLWGNVGINVPLTLLSNSVRAGVSAFCFHGSDHLCGRNTSSGVFFTSCPVQIASRHRTVTATIPSLSRIPRKNRAAFFNGSPPIWEWCFALASASIGLGTNFRELKQTWK